ncbi:hypothetical protein LINPERHAP2_LOCUS41330, partial [Linum perenne]
MPINLNEMLVPSAGESSTALDLNEVVELTEVADPGDTLPMFDNMQEAFHFYEDYAHLAGFGVRIRYQKKFKLTPTVATDGEPMVSAEDPPCRYLRFVCTHEGQKRKGKTDNKRKRPDE